MRAHPAYISESDAVDIRDFISSELAERYVLDTINLYWPGKVNSNHVFEIFSDFLEHEDAGKTRCDMVDFVKANKERYFMDGHTVLKMHETNLDAWANSMIYSTDMADELAIYALSDFTKKHTVIITNTKPWTTVHPDVTIVDTYQLLDMCDVKLIFLGNRKFGRLRPRPKECNNPIVYNPPVFPGSEPPSIRELETAESLLMMQNQNQNPDELLPHDSTQSSDVDRNLSPMELCVKNGMQALEDLQHLFGNDAMFLITEYIEPMKTYGQPLRDAMDVLVETVLPHPDAMYSITGYTEPPRPYKQPATDGFCVLVETRVKPYVLVNPDVERKIKHCSVELSRIDGYISFVPERNVCSTILEAGRPHTRSRCAPKPPRVSRHPRSANKSVHYLESEMSSDDETGNNKAKSSQPGSGPSEDRIRAQTTRSDYPKQRPLTLQSYTPVASANEEQSDADTELYYASGNNSSDDETLDVPKGAFKITTKSLKKPKNYKCLFCDKVCDDSKTLSAHKQNCDKMMYCTVCSRAFNNQTTYKRHVCSHSKEGVACDVCGKQFAYQSQLTTHSTVHSNVRLFCSKTDCGKSFKNKGDLKRHQNQHLSTKHKCPDCDYENYDIRNFESHRLYHSCITRYTCENCREEFIFNAQLRRHVASKSCTIAKPSSSPEY